MTMRYNLNQKNLGSELYGVKDIVFYIIFLYINNKNLMINISKNYIFSCFQRKISSLWVGPKERVTCSRYSEFPPLIIIINKYLYNKYRYKINFELFYFLFF